MMLDRGWTEERRRNQKVGKDALSAKNIADLERRIAFWSNLVPGPIAYYQARWERREEAIRMHHLRLGWGAIANHFGITTARARGLVLFGHHLSKSPVTLYCQAQEDIERLALAPPVRKRRSY